jgi:hypothetical protein
MKVHVLFWAGSIHCRDRSQSDMPGFNTIATSTVGADPRQCACFKHYRSIYSRDTTRVDVPIFNTIVAYTIRDRLHADMPTFNAIVVSIVGHTMWTCLFWTPQQYPQEGKISDTYSYFGHYRSTTGRTSKVGLQQAQVASTAFGFCRFSSLSMTVAYHNGLQTFLTMQPYIVKNNYDAPQYMPIYLFISFTHMYTRI